MSDVPEVRIGTIDGGFYVDVQARPTQRTCPTVDVVVQRYLDSCESQPKVAIDLNGAEWVDSTFAGWMTGLLRRLRETNGQLLLLNVGERCRRSLQKMHLSNLFPSQTAEPPEAVESITCTTSDRPDVHALQIMLAAHEQLAALDEDNQRVFGPIAEALRHQVAAVSAS